MGALEMSLSTCSSPSASSAMSILSPGTSLSPEEVVETNREEAAGEEEEEDKDEAEVDEEATPTPRRKATTGHEGTLKEKGKYKIG